MTNKEELQYLTALVLEASKWRISEGDDSDTIRLEVQDRIRRLTGINTTDENGLNQSDIATVTQFKEEIVKPRADKIADTIREKGLISGKEARRRYVQTHTRAWFDGKQSFYPNDQIVDIMLPNNRTKHVHKDSNEYKQYLAAHPDAGAMTQVFPAFPSMVNGGDNG